MKLDQNEFTVRIRYSAFAWIYEAANNNEFLEFAREIHYFMNTTS